MAQLLIKIGDNFPHKDLLLSLRTTDAGAKTVWIEREAARLPLLRQYAQVKLTEDQQIAIATSRWEGQCAYKQGEIVNIRSDDAPLGKRESYPRFWLARIDDAKLFDYLGVKTWEEAECIIHSNHDGPGDIAYNRRRLYLPDTSILRPDGITEISTSALGIRADAPVAYDAAKAVEHNSAGTYSIRASGGDYATLSAFESGEQCDLTTDGGQGHSIAEFYDDWSGGYSESAYVYFSGWTADADNMPIITVHAGEGHTGSPGSGFVWDNDGPTTYALRFDGQMATVRGLELKSSVSLSYNDFIFTNQGWPGRVERCILNGFGTTFLNIYSAEGINCLVCNMQGYAGGTFSGYKFSYCTFHGNQDRLMRNAECYNCVAISTVASHSYGTYYNCTGDYNVSDDETAPGTNSAHNATESGTFANAGSGDFKLAGSGSPAYELATPISGITDDIIGNARDATTPDAGAFEFVGGGGTYVTVTDSGSGADAIGQIAVALGVSDAGSAVDALPGARAVLGVADAGAGADMVSYLHNLLSAITDTGHGTESLGVSAGLAVQDSGVGTDSAGVAVSILITDTGSGVDAVTLIADVIKRVTDVGSGIDAIGGITVQAGVSDAGHGADTAGVRVALTVTDLGSAVDLVSTLQAALVTIADAGHGTDTVGPVSVSLAVADSCQGIDVIGAVQALLRVLDAGAGVDIASSYEPGARIRTITATITAPGMTITVTAPGIKTTIT